MSTVTRMTSPTNVLCGPEFTPIYIGICCEKQVIKHTIITKKPKVMLPAVVQDTTPTGNIRQYPLTDNMAAIQAAIMAAQAGHAQHTKPNKKIHNQQEFNDFLDDISVTQGEYATFNASRMVRSIFQVYYIHYVEVDLDKVNLFEHDGNPCPVQTILCHDLAIDRSPVEWHTGLKLRPLSKEEVENVIDDKVRNRIQERIRVLQQGEPRSSAT